MKRILIIFKKELIDTLRDRRTIMMMIVMPLIMIYSITSIMISMSASQERKAEAKTLQVGLITNGNAQGFRSKLLERKDMTIDEKIQPDQIIDIIQKNKMDFVIVFEKDFDRITNEKKSGAVEI